MHGEPWVEMTTSLWRPEDVPLDLLLLPIDPTGRTFADWEKDLSPERICTVSPTGSLEPGHCAVVPSTLAGVQYVAVASLLDDDRRMVNSEGLEACVHQCLDVCVEFGLRRMGVLGEILCWERQHLPEVLVRACVGRQRPEGGIFEVVLLFRSEESVTCARGFLHREKVEDRRKHERKEQRFQAVVLPDPLLEQWIGEIQDLSRGGMGLLLKGQSMPEGVVQVHVMDPRVGRVSCRGRIAWCRTIQSGEDESLFSVGIELISPTPSEFSSLVCMGGITG